MLTAACCSCSMTCRTCSHAHDVSAVLVDNFYRRRARLPDGRAAAHAYGLAADVYGFKLRDGTELIVERDWHGSWRASSARRVASSTDRRKPRAAQPGVRHRAELFHHILTPNYNEAHENHLHLDIKRGDREGRIR